MGLIVRPEVHKGLDDRYYIVDVARLRPPNHLRKLMSANCILG